MVTGIEAIGVALAILPLLVNQLDNYVRGIEKIKAFRRYKWRLEDFSSRLSAQYSMMLNTLELCLDGVVDDHDQKSDLIKNPRGPGGKTQHSKADWHKSSTGTMSHLLVQCEYYVVC
ncbi:hypothetical protein N7453_011176 [Penicillium expansum]|nr:hypothetical protein N7453_011176 [Penicillium expansum]